MKPHKLYMQNFGQFTNETVDFDKIGDVVYMIVGDTGAGKTMIFDGISIALFGKPSSEKRSGLSFEDFYCNRVEKDDKKKRPPMVVELVFSEKDHEYRVRREASWGTGGKAKDTDYISQLFKDGMEITDQGGDKSKKLETSKVTMSVQEIVGLTGDDFKKIIMLAQGEFQRFLEAKGPKRNEILGRIYNNSPHIDIENRLKGVNTCLSNRKEVLDNKMQEALSSCKIPEGLSEEDNARLDLYVEDKNDLWDALSKVEELLVAECGKITEELDKLEGKVIDLNRKMATAKQNNALLDQRKNLEEEQDALLASAPQYNALEQQKDDVKKAGSLLPCKDAFEKASLMLSDAVSKKDELEKKKKDCEEQVSILEEKASQLEQENLPAIEKNNKELIRIQGLLPVYEALEEHIKNYQECEGTVLKLSKELEEINKQLSEVENGKKANEEILSIYKDAGESAIDNAATILAGVNEQLQTLKKFTQELKETRELEAKMTSNHKDFLAAESITKKAQEDYDKASSLLREGRAGSLAKEMINALEDSSEVSCPVCGVVHTKADIGNFTKECENVPDEQEVDSLYKELTKARDEEQKLHGTYSKLVGSVDLAIKSRVEEAKKIFHKDLNYEEILSSDVVEKEDERLSLEKEKAEKAYQDAVKAKEIKDEALLKKNKFEEEQASLAKKKEDFATEKQAEDRKLAALSRDVQNGKNQLKDFPATKALAEKAIVEMENKIQSLKASCEEARKAHQAMEKSLVEVFGQLQEKTKQIVTLQEEELNAKKNMEAKLEELGYENISQGMEVLRVDGHDLSSLEEVSKWCDKVDKAVKEYRSKASDVESRLNENQKNTKDLSYVDLDGLSKEIADLGKEKEALKTKSNEEYSSLKQTKESIAIIHKGMDELQQLHKVELELKPMVDNTTSKVYKFRDYVLSDFFKQIVEHASYYFMKLMDGKYSLETVVKVNKTAKKDADELRELEIHAVDEKGNHSNIALLSGGQTFEASLALALGLSEVVQMQKTGKVNIESMFIDEGFGTLDGQRLDKSMMVLNSMTEQNRQIGIITHVDKLVNADTYKKLEVSHENGLATLKFIDNK